MQNQYVAKNGAVFRYIGKDGKTAPDWFTVDWVNADAQGNRPWHHAGTQPPYTFKAASIWVTDGVVVAQRGDGTYFDPATGKDTAAPPGQTTPPSVPVPPVTPTPPVVTPAPPATPPATPPSVPVGPVMRTSRVFVVPLRFLPPANTPANKIPYDAFMATLPKVTQANLQRVFAPLADYWLQQTFGRWKLNLTVVPEVSINAVCAPCDFAGVFALANHALNGQPYDNLFIVTPYVCSNYGNMCTTGNLTYSWNTHQENLPEYAHEFGHQCGLSHTARDFAGEGYRLYGGPYDMMQGPAAGLLPFRADHKIALGAFQPRVFSDNTPGRAFMLQLRDIATNPDAIWFGPYTAEYCKGYEGFDEIWLSKREFIPNPNYGGSDTTWFARVAKGQSYTIAKTPNAPGYIVAHAGNGNTTITVQ